jgi:glycerol-3-phosphate acyltransferase PlsY
MATYITIAAAAYLLGSIPFGYLLVRAFRGHDIRESGSGNIGATNVARAAPALGVATLFLDAAKGFFAVQVSYLLIPGYSNWAAAGGSPSPWAPPDSFPSQWYVYPALAAVFAVVGHDYPAWLRFRGGKGVATGVGAFLSLAPATMLAALVVFLIVVALFRRVSLGSIVASAAFPILAYVLHSYQSSRTLLTAMAATALLIVARHHENLRRLLAGSEPRWQWRRT